jgi:hypothetical protein
VSDPFYDGLCGVPARFTMWDGTHLRCKFEMGHGGDHDWEKHRDKFVIRGGTFSNEHVQRRHPVVEHCCCAPVREMDGTIIEYIFSPNCEPHNRKPSV